MLTSEHYAAGETKDSSRVCLNGRVNWEEPQNRSSSGMPESVQQSKRTTCRDKSTDSKPSSPALRCTGMSEAGSTSRGKGCYPYWNDYVREVSERLWLPTGTGCSGISLKGQAVNSWFSTETWTPEKNNPVMGSSVKTCSPYSTISLVGCTGGGVTGSKATKSRTSLRRPGNGRKDLSNYQLKAVKIRVYPTTEQATALRNWQGGSRFVYNQVVAVMKSPKEDRPPEARSWMSLYKHLSRDLHQKSPWLKEVPYQIKKVAVRDCLDAFILGCKKAKETKEPFELSFRRRKGKQNAFIPCSAIRGSGEIYPSELGKLHFSEPLEKFVPPGSGRFIRDSRLQFQRGRWYLCLSYATPKQPVNHENQVVKTVALDPGVRTFITGFSETEAFKLGHGAFERVAALATWCDRLISKRAILKKRGDTHVQRQRLSRVIDRAMWEITDCIDELHWKSINFLLANYLRILLPTFEVSDMVRRLTRRIRSKTVRNMLTLRHFQFKQRLKYKAKAAGVEVIEVNEAYTSKTASWTGEVLRIGGAKFIQSHGFRLDRDLNGARGIYLRALVDTPWLRSHPLTCISSLTTLA